MMECSASLFPTKKPDPLIADPEFFAVYQPALETEVMWVFTPSYQ